MGRRAESMGCLFSKQTTQSDTLLQSEHSSESARTSSSASPAAADEASASRATPEPAAAADEAAVFATPDPLKPMGRGGFAEITTGIQEQLGRCERPRARLEPQAD